MHETPKQNLEKVALVYCYASGQTDHYGLEESKGLIQAAEAEVAQVFNAPIRQPDVRYWIGSGKLEMIKEALAEAPVDSVVFNVALAPTQERNLEQALGVRVIDRVRLILDIFALRAQTGVGKLQVELAQLNYLSTRLVRAWTHLERQKGGIGLRGPGEKQIETDRRLIQNRIKTVKNLLESAQRQRHQSRKRAKRTGAFRVSLVGYTNAGKSTLFNQLTQADVWVQDQVFATLNSTTRRLNQNGQTILLSDTVGFIRDLPHSLVEAFHGTLEELVESDLLLHVVDASAPDKSEQMTATLSVIEELKADSIPLITIYNKIDQLSNQPDSQVTVDESGMPHSIWLSAYDKSDQSRVIEAIDSYIHQSNQRYQIKLGMDQADIRAWLYHNAQVLDEKTIQLESDDSQMQWIIEFELDLVALDQLKNRFEGLEIKHLGLLR